MPILKSLPKSKKTNILFDADVVHNILPQKSPFVFVDEIIDLDGFENSNNNEKQMPVRMVANLHLSGKECFFEGHFPEEPVMPGVLQVEALAQAGTLLAMFCKDVEKKEAKPIFMGIDYCRFRKPIVPPSNLILDVSLESDRHGILKFNGKVFIENVDNEKRMLACDAKFSAALL